MCGICGIVYKEPGRVPDESMLGRMCDTLVHRGPDDSGRLVSGRAGLAMRRLSIIDLASGHQPISNEDRTRHIVFNGEIYNYQDLSAELEAAGHRFRTASDTETILHGYESWREDVFSRLNGMFAFAVWDELEQMLILARDRIGIKPLYYYEDSEKVVFGSEIKAILACEAIDKEIDYDALNNFLTFEYIPAPRSIFRSVRKLEPGHYLTMKQGSVTIRPYWTLQPKEQPWTAGEAEERLAELLRDAVRLRLIADVPLGAFLSGGIDSSIMVSQMAGLMDRPVKTFSIGFRESSYNELSYAKAVADMYHTDHHEFIVEADALELTEKLIRQLDEPFGDFSIFPTYIVSRMARDHVTVALSGDGGDELFAGYDTYKAHLFDRRYYHLLPKLVKRYGFETLAHCLPPTERKKGAINSYKRFIEGTRLPKTLAHARWMVFLHEKQREALFTPDARAAVRSEDPYDFIHRHSAAAGDVPEITRTGYIDIKTYLVDNILVKVDRMSMATSLEARVPYLDHRIVEFACSLPPGFKMDRWKTKVILNRTFWNALPPEVQNRDKQGFSIPIKNWIRNELRPMMTDLLNAERLQRQGIFNGRYVEQLVNEHVEGRANHSHLLWALMVFQQWNELYGNG
ncbi:asparagine synthase (glutamine-hydrolyzing) [bacterium]|nr:asparagine synthase (glutamine-hydrolyzing) [bacterium]